MARKLFIALALVTGLLIPHDSIARGGGGFHGGGFHGGGSRGSYGRSFHGAGHGSRGVKPAGRGKHVPAQHHGHGHHGHHGCRTCAFGGWWGGAPLWWDFGLSALWYPWLLTPVIAAEASDDPTIVVLPESTPTQTRYNYSLVIHQDTSGKIRTEQVLLPSGDSVIYIHDKDNAKRIIEKHTVDLQGKHHIEKSDNGSIKRMRIKGETKITRYTVDGTGNVLNTQISYAKQV